MTSVLVILFAYSLFTCKKKKILSEWSFNELYYAFIMLIVEICMSKIVLSSLFFFCNLHFSICNALMLFFFSILAKDLGEYLCCCQLFSSLISYNHNNALIISLLLSTLDYIFKL